MVPLAQGLAAGIAALFTGLVAAVVAAIAAWLLPVAILRFLVPAAVLWCVVSVVSHERENARAEAKRRLERGLDVPLPPPSNFTVHGWVGDPENVMEVDGAIWQGRWTDILDPRLTCTARLTAAEAAELEGALRVLEGNPSCDPRMWSAGVKIQPYIEINWTRGAQEWTFKQTTECGRMAEVQQITRALFDIRGDAELDRRRTCK